MNEDWEAAVVADNDRENTVKLEKIHNLSKSTLIRLQNRPFVADNDHKSQLMRMIFENILSIIEKPLSEQR